MSGGQKRKQTTPLSGGATGTSTSSTNPKKQTQCKEDKKKVSEKNNVSTTRAMTTSTTRRSATTREEDETLLETFKNHPFGLLFLCSATYFSLYWLYYFILLKHPEYVTNNKFIGRYIKLRPAVRLADERQFLILGSIGSGTDRIAEGLSRLLKLEVGVEVLDAESTFARDGTVSQFLGIRYTPLPHNGGSDSAHQIQSLITELCVNRNKGAKDEFHPIKSYRPYHNCSSWDGWTKCHSQVCVSFMLSEWSCAVRHDERLNKCTTSIAPVRRTLYVVQHPVKMIQELLYAVCPGKTKTPHPAFRQIALPWLTPETVTNTTSCAGQVAWYVVNYNLHMVNAINKGLIQTKIIKYEDVTLCDIARSAGFDSEETAVYMPNVAKYQKICNHDTSSDTGSTNNVNENDDVNMLLPDVNIGASSKLDLSPLTWKIVREAGGKQLELALTDLCNQLSYSTLILEEGEFDESESSSNKKQPSMETDKDASKSEL
jgi:hypothetical protein